MTNNRSKLFNALKNDGYDNFKSEDEFNQYVDNADNRNKLFNALQEEGYDNFKSVDELNSYLGYQTYLTDDGVPYAPLNKDMKAFIDSRPELGTNVTHDWGADKVNVAEPIKDEEGNEYYPLKPEKVARDEYLRSLTPVEEQLNNRLAENQTKLAEARKRSAAERTAQSKGGKKTYPGLLASMKERQEAYEENGVSPTRVEIADIDEEVGNLLAEQEYLKEAKKMVEAVRNDAGFFTGMKDAVDASYITFGMSDKLNAERVSNIQTKLDAGEQLTNSEQDLLTSLGLNQMIVQQYNDELGRWYKAGMTTADMAPFMAEMALNPMSGAGKAAARFVAKKFGEKGAKAIAAKVMTRLVGDVAGAAAMTATTGLASVEADALQRQQGYVTTELGEDGNIVGTGFEGGKDEATAWREAFTSRAIENWSEMVGNYFSPVGKAVGKVSAKALNAMKLGKVNDFLANINSSQTAKLIDDFTERTQWNSSFGEAIEEEIGMVTDMLLVGDTEWKDIANLDNQIDMFLGVATFGTTLSLLRMTGYRTPKYRAKKAVLNADRKGLKVYGEELWEKVREVVDISTDEELSGNLEQLMGSVGASEEQVKAAITYASAVKTQQAVNTIKEKEKIEKPNDVSVQTESAYDDGMNTDEPYLKHYAKIELDAAEMLLEKDAELMGIVMNGENNPAETINYLIENGYSEEQVNMAKDYYTALHRMNGITDALIERIDQQVADANAEVDNNTNTDNGNVTRVVLRNGEVGYVVAGNVVQGEKNSVDVNASDKVVYVRMSDGHVHQMNPNKDIQGVAWVDTPQNLKEYNEKGLRRELLNEAIGEIDWNPNTPNPKVGDSFELNGVAVTIVSHNSKGGMFVVPTEEYQTAVGSDKKMQELKAKAEQTEPVPAEMYKDWASAKIDAQEDAAKAQQEDVIPGESVGEEVNTEVNNPSIVVQSETAQEDAVEGNPVAETTESGAGEEVKSGKPIIPTKADGSIDFVAYGKDGSFKVLGDKYGAKMPNKIAVTAKAYADDLKKAQQRLEKAEEALDNAPIGREAKFEEAKNKAEREFEAVKREADFWAEMDADVKATQARHEAILNPQTGVEVDMTPISADELIARELSVGNIKLNKESFKKETGYGDKEANELNKGSNPLFAEDGMSIEVAGERLMEMDREQGTNFFDQTDANAGRDALISFLGGVKTRKEINDYIKNNRAAQQKKESEGIYNEMEDAVMRSYHTTLEDYVNQMEAAEAENPFMEERPDEIMAIFAEEQAKYEQSLNNIEDGQTERNIAEGSGTVLSKEQTGDTGGTEEQQESQRNGLGTPEESEGSHDGEQGQVRYDVQGNPIDEQGNLIIESVNSIDEITDEDFTTPTRSISIPNVPQNVADAIGTDGKPIVIKKNIFERNSIRHEDVSPEQSREILKSALYSPNLYGQNQKVRKPHNWVLINTKDKNGNNKIVLLEVNRNKDNVEIVHWHYTDERGVEKIRKQAEREDGQLLILPSVETEEVGALSDPTLGLSSEDKDSNVSEENKGNGKNSRNRIGDVFDEARKIAIKQKLQQIKERAKAWEKVGVKVRIVERVEDIDNPDAVAAIQKGHIVPGWYEASTNEAYIFLPHVRGVKDADMTIIHEAISHRGLRDLLGKERFNELCDKVWESMSKKSQEEYSKYPGVSSIKDKTERQRAAADEYIAHLAEKQNLTPKEQSIWDKIVEWFKELFAFTDNKGKAESILDGGRIGKKEISELIRLSYAEYLKSGASKYSADGDGTRFMVRHKDSEQRKSKIESNNIIDQAVSFVTGLDMKSAKQIRLDREQKRKEDAKEIYESVLSGDFNDVILQKINQYIEDATPFNSFGQRISQRLPQGLERSLREGARKNAVDALFSRICESAVPASRRASEAGRREIEERKKEALKGWAIATGNWHTDLSDIVDEQNFIRQGTDSKVYLSNDGKYVIKTSFGKPFGKRFRPDIDNVALFNRVFPNSSYEIIGYGEFDGKFARILKQPFVDFADKTNLNANEREEYMRSLGFEPINDTKTAFSNGTIIAADLQKSNILKDAAGNISVIDADMKLHTKDVGGNYSYPPVEADLPEGSRFRTVYHGSGAEFDHFDHSFMGTGEGSQVYGWGTYVTPSKRIAIDYADAAVSRQYRNDKQAQMEDNEIFWAIDRRHLYEVEIPDDNGQNYIRYDLPLPEAQLKTIKDAFVKTDVFKKYAEKFGKELSEERLESWLAAKGGGGRAYNLLGNFYDDAEQTDKEVSKFLSSIGFTGMSVPTNFRDEYGDHSQLNYVIFNESDLKIQGHTRFRTLEQINQTFNEELHQQIDGTFPQGHIYQLGSPSAILLSTGIADVPIQLNSARLEDKSKNFGHDFDLSELKDLVKAIHNPMAIFAYGDKNKAQNIIVEIQHEGKNFIVGLSIRPSVGGRVLDVNSIRNVFPKDNAEWLNWVSQGKMLYADKERIQNLINQQRTNLADVDYLDLDSVANIVKDFPNPTLPEEKTLFRTVYHGSAAEFDKFDHSKMGSGAGSQVFGWGTYVTESEKIGRDYGDVALQGKNKFKYVGNQEVSKAALMDAEQIMDRAGSYEEAMKRYGNKTLAPGTALEEAVTFLKSTKKEDWQGQRHLYEVEIPDMKRGNYIVYGNNVTDKAADKVFEGIYERVSKTDEYDSPMAQKELKKELDGVRSAYGQGKNGIWKDLYGDIATYLGSEKEASLFLRSLGYVGIEYPSGTIFKGNNGDAKNYVIFDEKDLKIANHTRFRMTNEEKEELRDSEETKALFDYAKKRFGRTFDLREAGYILPDGSMLDFSGRHEMSPGSDTSHLKGYRSADHRSIVDVAYDFEGEETGFETDMADFINRGAIRIDTNAGSINLTMKPTSNQKAILQRLIQRNDGNVWVDFSEGWDTEHYVEYSGVRPFKVLFDIDKYYNEGIKPEGNSRFRIANRNQEIFVSNAQKAVEGIKQEKATPQQWLAMIEKNGGLKAGEDKWLGLSDWLKGLDKKSVTKDEILDFIGENKIRIEEVHYGEGGSIDELRNKYPMWDEAFEIDDDFGGVSVSLYNDKNAADIYNEANPESKVELQKSDRGYEYLNAEDEEKVIDWARTQIVSISPINSIRLNYTTEGLENNQEIALTVPTIEPWNVDDEIHFGDAGEGRAVAWIRFGETTIYDEILDAQKVDEFHEPYKNINGMDVYKPIGSFRSGDYIVHGKGRSGDMIYVVYINDNQIPVAHKSLDDAKDAMNEYYKEHPRKLKRPRNVLVIDEIQSKRHQEGREHGYRSNSVVKQLESLMKVANEKNDDYFARLKELKSEFGLYSISEEVENDWRNSDKELAKRYEARKEAGTALADFRKAHENELKRDAVPAAPFEKNWSELAMKRMLRYAAENGYDKVAWTTGTQQAERYSLGQVIDEVMSSEWKENQNGWGDGSADMVKTVYANGADIELQYVVDKNGTIIADINGEHEGRSLGEVFGKDIATKLMADEGTTISNAELRIGGEGMKGFYDKMLPSFVNKYVKKWGTKVQDIELPNVEEAGRIMHSVDVTDAMKESVMEGQTMFRTLNEPAVDYVSQSEGVVSVPRSEVKYTMNNIGNELYKVSGNYLRKLYKDGTLGKVLRGDYAEIDLDKAKSDYDKAKKYLGEYLNELEFMKYESTEAAQNVINDVIRDVEYSLDYYRDLALGKDVWRTKESPRFRIVEKHNEDVQKEVDKFVSKYKSSPIRVVNYNMTDAEKLDVFEGTLNLNEINRLFEKGFKAGYNRKNGKIYIFADNELTDELEESLFHENLHANISDYSDLMDAVWSKKEEVSERLLNRVKNHYDESKWKEEFFVYSISSGQSLGNIDKVLSVLSDDMNNRLIELLKTNGYNYEQEKQERNRANIGRSGSEFGGELRKSGESVQTNDRRRMDVRNSDVQQVDGREEKEEARRKEKSQREQAERLKNLFDQVADMGLDGVLGNEAYNSTMIKVYAALPDEARKEIINNSFEHYSGDYIPATSDYLIGAKADVFDKVIGFIKDALRKIGIDVALTPSDVKYLMWRSRKPLNRNNVFEVAEDIDAKRRMGVEDGNASSTRFRITNFDPSDKRDALIKEYDAYLKSGKFNFIEAFQDSMYSVKVLMDKIVEATGKEVRDYENAYDAENQLGSINKPMQEKYLDKFYKPLLEEVKKLSDKYGREAVERYIYCKSGLERNEVLRQRDADEAYESSKAELDEKLSKGEIDQAQYNTLLAQVDAQRQKTLSEDVDYSGIRGMLYNIKARQINEDYESGKIDKATRDQQLADLEKNKKDAVKEWKTFAEGQVAALEGKASTKELDALWNKINAATNETLRMDYESGMIDKETYDAEKNMMKYYVPLRNWDDTTAEEMYEYRSELVRPVSSNQKRAKGRESQADNPIATIGLMAQNAIVRGNKNKVKQKFYAFVANRETSLATVRDVWYVKNALGDWEAQYADTSSAKNSAEFDAIMQQFEEDMEQLEAQGNAFRGKLPMGMKFRASGRQKQSHVVPVMINGKEYAVYVNGNPRAAQAINGETNPESVNKSWEWYDKLKRMYGAGLTSWNPDFIIPNMIRDGIHASTMTFIDAGPMAAAKFAINGPRALAQVYAMITGQGKGFVNPKYQAYFEEFVANGGETGYTEIHTLEDYKKEYEKLINEAKGFSAKKGIKNAISSMGGLLETANRIFEDVNRFNAYVSARESGESIMRSVSAAKNITVNFNRKGAGFANNSAWGIVAGWMSKWILFFNPAVQGMEQLITKSKANPKRAKLVGATILSSGFLMPMLNEMLVAAFGDDEEEDNYWNQSDYKRRNNWMLFTGNGYVTIPLPPVLRELYGMGDILYGAITGHITPQRAAIDVARQVQSAIGFFNLIPEVSQEPDMVTYVKGFAPDIAAPILDIVSNTNFMGRPIAKWSDYNESIPEYERVYKGTSKHWVELSKLLNEIGGNEGRRSEFWGNFINPAMMEHLVTSYGGGIGKTINNLAGMATDWVMGDTENLDPFRKSPILPRFYTPVDEKSAVPGINRTFYEFRNHYNIMKSALKTYKDGVNSKEHPEYQKYIDEMKENGEMKFMDYFEKVNKEIKKLEKEREENPNNKKAIDEKIIDLKAKASVKSREILK